MSNYTLPLGSISDPQAFYLEGRDIVDVRNIYQALRIFQGMDTTRPHLSKLAQEVGVVPGLQGIQIAYAGAVCNVAGGVHPGLKSIDYKDYGLALAVARRLSAHYDNLVFITADANPVTNTILQADDVIDPIRSWPYYFDKCDRPAAINQTHILVDRAKAAFIEIHGSCQESATDFDAKDLIYQCLFRLFSLSPRDYIISGQVLARSWAGVQYHEIGDDGVVFDDEILRCIYFEQRANLLTKYYRPEAQLFIDLSAIFSRFKDRGNLQTVKGVPYLVVGGVRTEISIREVAPEMARRIHGAFHYIHTPRNDGYALGLYLGDDVLPFSVLAIEKVHREYKKSALESYNLSHKHVYEITRLYSAPNTPRNSSSFFLSLASSYLKGIDKNWQATISSFMPSYATGGSMLGGGFEQMLFVKPCRHYYEPANFGFMTHTNRTSSSLVRISNRTELMPVVELIHARASVLNGIGKEPQLLTLREGSVV